MNTHLQEEKRVMAPPSRGPNRKASANMADIKLVVSANLEGGTSSKKIVTITA